MVGPKRIVCLTEEPTEILFALGEGHRIVGRSAYTLRPAEATSIPVVSAFIGGSVDKIVALEPDLVIGFSDIQAKLASELISAHLNVLIFNQRSIVEIFEMMRIVGSMVGRVSEADALIETYQAEIARLRATPLVRRPRVYFEEWDEPMITAIEWVSELIEIAGGKNIFSHLANRKGAKDRFVSVEDVVEAAPDVVMGCWCGKPFDEDSFKRRFAECMVPAIERQAIFELPPEEVLQPGPGALGDGLRRIRAILERVVSS